MGRKNDKTYTIFFKYFFLFQSKLDFYFDILLKKGFVLKTIRQQHQKQLDKLQTVSEYHLQVMCMKKHRLERTI